MTAISHEARVSDLVLEEPSRARVFERYGINYCCGGDVPLADACKTRGVDVGAVVTALEETRPEEGQVDWTAASIADLCAHIVEHHHAYLREELPLLHQLVDKVAQAHGGRHAEVVQARAIFAQLADHFERHMVAEEQVLFPACAALERGPEGEFMFGSVDAPISVMVHDHDEVGEALAQIRALLRDYVPPVDACNSYRAMLDRLETLEKDTHEHVHKENAILFPRASALEHAA